MQVSLTNLNHFSCSEAMIDNILDRIDSLDPDDEYDEDYSIPEEYECLMDEDF